MNPLLERVLENPFVYRLWQAPLADHKFAPAERHLRHSAVGRILDVGCGPGTNAARFTGCDYTGIDINPRYLSLARSKYAGRFVECDIAQDDLVSLGTFDTVLVNSFLHHLPDAAVQRVLAQLQQVMRPHGVIHVLELVLPDRFSIATPMARLDRGRYARTLSTWQRMMEAEFDVPLCEPYSYGGGLWAMVYFQGRLRTCDSR